MKDRFGIYVLDEEGNASGNWLYVSGNLDYIRQTRKQQEYVPGVLDSFMLGIFKVTLEEGKIVPKERVE